jgi:hypothetical protein
MPRAKHGVPVKWARSSAGEHLPDTEGVTGSIPVAPTTLRPEQWPQSASALPILAAKAGIRERRGDSQCCNLSRYR